MTGRRRQPLFIDAPAVEKPLRFRRPDRIERLVRREWEVVTIWNVITFVGIMWSAAADPDATERDLDAIMLTTARMVPGARQTLLEDGEDEVELSLPVLLAFNDWILSLDLRRRGDAIWFGPPLMP